MKITKEIQIAILKYLSVTGKTQEKLGEDIKISKQAVNHWLSGYSEGIKDTIWLRLYPLIKEYLPPEFNNPFNVMKYRDSASFEKVLESIKNPFPSSILPNTPPKNMISQSQSLKEAAPIPAAAMTKVPIITMASAAGYDPVYDPFDEMIANNSIGEEYFSDVKAGMVALKVIGDSMSPDLPNGSIVLVDTTNFPKRGSKVVARLKDIGIVVKMYNRKDNIVTLSSINPNGQNFKWNIKEQRDYCLFMWQVRKSIIDEDQQRWENHKINGKIK